MRAATIRSCEPNSIEEWREYYYSNARSCDHIDALGQTLFARITQELPGEKRFHSELQASICADDCVQYMHAIVIDRTYNGYAKERRR